MLKLHIYNYFLMRKFHILAYHCQLIMLANVNVRYDVNITSKLTSKFILITDLCHSLGYYHWLPSYMS